MFLDNLSSAILHHCDEHLLTYEAASELCNISRRYFGSIVRMQTSPTIATLEKISNGFQLTPNDLLIIPSELSYRVPMIVSECAIFQTFHGNYFYPRCPRCKNTMEREFQSFCDRCGQCLDWNEFHT